MSFQTIIIVLGRKLFDDGGIHPLLKERLEKTKEIYEREINPMIITSGRGVAKRLECDAMKEWLMNNNVKNVICESKSMNTVENAFQTLSMLFRENVKIHENYSLKELKKIVVVSSDSHMVRCKSIFTTFFFKWRKYFEGVTLQYENSKTIETNLEKGWLDKEWKSEQNGRVFFLCSEGYDKIRKFVNFLRFFK
eukprot:TRINITY_DN14056_c0_g1_i1.p1 TRINITY_DN14056_c0_g1~~TRINITY_DN14056_c0_g1_i1.p1  ORF type:complete len:194 (+),score=31.15 TRINITY_DN14056_c0_g1_i1:34-615(+)